MTATVPRRAERPAPDTPDAPRAVIYCRLSKDQKKDELGVRRQEAECRALAKAQGWQVADVHTDDDTSAYSGKRRPGYEALMAAVRAGEVDVLVAWHPDRLHRSPTELETFIEAVEASGAAVHTVKAGHTDLSTPIGRLVARQLGGIARYESEHRSERLVAKLDDNAAKGLTHGRPSYGWRAAKEPDGTRRDVLDPAEAEVVRAIARDVLAGRSLRSISQDLAERQVPTPRGGPWTKNVVRDLALRPRNAGIRVHRGEEVGPGTWEPLLDRSTWEQVRAVLADPARRTTTGSTAAHLLSGIARCGVCGSVVHRALNRGVPAYRCHANACVSRRKADVDDFVTAVVLGRLGRPDAADLLAPSRRPERVAAAEEARTLRGRLDTAADQYADGVIDARQLQRITERLRPQLVTAEREARVVDDFPLLEGLVGVERAAEVWETRSLEQRRAIVHALVEVIILPTRKGARSFDPDSVKITWRSE